MCHSGKNDIKKKLIRKYFISRQPGTRCVTVISEEITFPSLVLLLPLPARWRWTRAPAVGHMSVDRLPGSQQVTSTLVQYYNSTHKVCTTYEMNWERFQLGSKNNLTIISSFQSSYCYQQSKSKKGLLRYSIISAKTVCLLSRKM